MYNVNGPPRGFNVTSDQSSYDLVYKDIIICSTLGTYNNGTTSYNLTVDNLNQIYKAELTSATVDFNSFIPTSVKNNTLILSIPQLNGNTLRIAGNTTGTNQYQSQTFCQIPDNNTPLRIQGTTTSNNIISLFIGYHIFETIQYYNPPLNKLNTIDVQWFTKDGTMLPVNDTSGNITSFYFTLRIHYFQKRNNMTQFSTSVFNYADTGTMDSLFQPINRSGQ